MRIYGRPQNNICLVFTPLIGQSRCPVRLIDDSAVLVALLKDGLLHYPVIFMGVHPDVVAETLAEIGDQVEDPMGAAVACRAVDRDVRLVVRPGAAVDPS